MLLLIALVYLIVLYVAATEMDEEPWPYVAFAAVGLLILPYLAGIFLGTSAMSVAAVVWMITVFAILIVVRRGRVRAKEAWTCASCGLRNPPSKTVCTCGETMPDGDLPG